LITRTQVRMARAALGWGVRELADKTGLAPNTVSRYENGTDSRVETLRLIQEALEKAGVLFVPADEAAGPGVRLRDPRRR